MASIVTSVTLVWPRAQNPAMCRISDASGTCHRDVALPVSAQAIAGIAAIGTTRLTLA